MCVYIYIYIYTPLAPPKGEAGPLLLLLREAAGREDRRGDHAVIT